MGAQVLERILAVDYNFPTSIPVSPECKDLLAKILVADPAKRFTISDIQQHPWSAAEPSQCTFSRSSSSTSSCNHLSKLTSRHCLHLTNANSAHYESFAHVQVHKGFASGRDADER